MAKKKSNHYIDNKEFFGVMCEWKDEIKAAEDAGEPKPVIPDYVGECFLKIAEHLSYKPNFINYPFKDDMIGDGIENCVMYASNFDPEKSTNPFSYFTQIIYFAFLRRIQKEKKQNYIKYKATIEADQFNEFRKWFKNNYFDEDKKYTDIFDITENDLAKFEPKKKAKTKRKKSE
jgi:hypothetical protein